MHEISAWKSVRGESSAFVSITAVGRDQQSWLPLAFDLVDRVHVPGANCVERMRLWDSKAVSVVLCTSAAAGRNRQASCDQSMEEGPLRDVDGCSMGQRPLQPPFDSLEPYRWATERVAERDAATGCGVESWAARAGRVPGRSWTMGFTCRIFWSIGGQGAG